MLSFNMETKQTKALEQKLGIFLPVSEIDHEAIVIGEYDTQSQMQQFSSNLIRGKIRQVFCKR